VATPVDDHVPPPTADAAYCGHCGEALLGPDGSPRDHASCTRMLALEPPRWCVHCRRRMRVQVTPLGWSATCVAHRTTTG
jgi:hypothetical protein